MNSARQEVAFCVLDEKLYVLGGLGGGTRVEAFNAQTGSWESLPALPMSLHHGSAAAVGNKLYSIGGFATTPAIFDRPVENVFEFDPQAETWQERAALPSQRGGLISVALDGLVYAIGGRDAQESLATVTVYDPNADSWSPAAPMPVPLDHLAAAALGGKIYVAGGRLTQGGRFIRNDSPLLIYDPSGDSWESGARLPTPRSGLAAAAIGGFFVVMGGEIPGVFSVNEAYDPAHDRWFRLDDLPTARHGLAAGVIGSQIITAAGGLVDGIAASGVAEAFDVLAEVESVAQFATGPDVTSQLAVSNPGNQTVRVRFELHHQETGQDFQVFLDGQQGSVFQTEIEPGGLKIFTSDRPSDPEAPTLSGGVTLFSDAPLLSNVLFSGPQGFAGVAGLQPGRRFFVSILRDLDQQADSGLAVADVSGLSNTVTLELLNESGQVEARSQRTLQPFGHFANLFDELMWDVEIFYLTFTGSIRIEAEHEIGAVAILLRGNQFATLPVRRVEE